MKKIKLLLLLICAFLVTGCTKNNLDNAKIYTTIYPIEYITNYLYGENSEVESIYPEGVSLNDYTLTSKQIDNYSSGDLFIYIGLGKEKDFAKSFINKNKDLLIIDATYGLSSNNLPELWLAPNNFLMLAKNIKTTLNEYLDNSVKEDRVNELYNELYVKVSWIDAELRSISKSAKENNNSTIVTSSNAFKYLESYGFNIVSLEDIESSKNENALNDIKSKFKNSSYSNIIKLSGEEDTNLMKELKDNYKANIIEINDLIKNSDTSSDYVSIQYENISIIRDLLLK